jgi:hypothetical protein
MTIGYSQTPRLLKGAIIQFSAPLFVPVPNIIIFQYNPESLSRSLEIWKPPADEKSAADLKQQSLEVQPQDPEESFNVVLELDATDEMENPVLHPQTIISGVADRIAALEVLTYPPDTSSSGLLGGSLTVAASAIGGLTAGGSATVTVAERKTVPLILFFFGPGRIVPVRITTLTVDEQAFNPLLYPIRAKVTVGMKVLNPAGLTDDNTAVYKLAKACYEFTLGQKKALALARDAENALDVLTPFLPF